MLRKKPPGRLLSASAHAVEREYRVLAALADTAVPVPRVLLLCEDATVLGTPFYVMVFVAGRIFSDPAIPGVDAAERRLLWTAALATLATLHATDVRAVGLQAFGKPGSFYARQIRTLTAVSRAQAATLDADSGRAVGPIPSFAANMQYFADTLTLVDDAAAAAAAADADAPGPVLIHGDYKIDNLVFHPTEPRVVGVLDWELSTLGHPLSDLCNLLSPYVLGSGFGPPADEAKSPDSGSVSGPGSDSDLASVAAAVAVFTGTPGVPTRDEAVRIYQQAAATGAGRWAGSMGVKLDWGLAFMLCRNSVITQGISARHARRQASSAHAATYRALTPRLAALATRLVQADRGRRQQQLGGSPWKL